MSLSKYLPAPAVTALAVAPLVLLLAGCTLTRPSASPSGDTPGGSPAPSVSASTATDSPSGTPSTPGPSGGGTASGSRCRTDEVRVTQRPAPGGGAAGGVYDWLIFTNTSTRTCTVFGFPGVSYVTGPSGQQVNEPARRDGGTPHLVTLAPGKGGYAQLRTGHPEAYPDTCKPVAVAGYRVYLPDESTPVFVPAPTRQCSTKGVNGTTVTPVEALGTE